VTGVLLEVAVHLASWFPTFHGPPDLSEFQSRHVWCPSRSFSHRPRSPTKPVNIEKLTGRDSAWTQSTPCSTAPIPMQGAECAGEPHLSIQNSLTNVAAALEICSGSSVAFDQFCYDESLLIASPTYLQPLVRCKVYSA
jgi:hypothetical protein